MSETPSERREANEKVGKGKKGGFFEKYKWYIIGGLALMAGLVFFFVNRSNAASNAQNQSATNPAASGIDPNTGIPYSMEAGDYGMGAYGLGGFGGFGNLGGGTQGPAGPRGPAGKTGKTGKTGKQGKRGTRGPRGPKGPRQTVHHHKPVHHRGGPKGPNKGGHGGH